MKQIHDIGITAQLFGADAWSDPSIPEKAGSNAEGIMFTRLASHGNESFQTKMAAYTNSAMVSECSAPAYDGMHIIANVLSEAGTNPDAIRNAMFKVDYKDGVAFDEIQFDSNGDLKSASYSVGQIKDGKAVIIN